MIGLPPAERSNTLPPTLALLALAVWQCGAMLLVQDAANRWLARPHVWLAGGDANSMVLTFYLWNMTAAVLAAVILLPTGLWPQPETLSTAWWWLRLGGGAAGGGGLVPCPCGGSRRASCACCRSCTRSDGPNGRPRRHPRRAEGGSDSPRRSPEPSPRRAAWPSSPTRRFPGRAGWGRSRHWVSSSSRPARCSCM